jgi:hypothetical protein
MISFRKPEVSDAAGALSFFLKLVVQDTQRVERFEDVSKLTMLDEIAWLENLAKRIDRDEMRSVIGVNADEEIVMLGEIERRPRWVEKHVAEIRFGLLPSHQVEGAKLVLLLEELAKELKIEVLIYFHLETQQIGLEIMRQSGFVECGRIEKYYKMPSHYVDRIFMMKNIG